jgi:hypothetical protein
VTGTEQFINKGTVLVSGNLAMRTNMDNQGVFNVRLELASILSVLLRMNARSRFYPVDSLP